MKPTAVGVFVVMLTFGLIGLYGPYLPAALSFGTGSQMWNPFHYMLWFEFGIAGVALFFALVDNGFDGFEWPWRGDAARRRF